MKKVYVQVTAMFEADGSILPMSIIWADGSVYKIDRIMNICPAASLAVGGAGIRYTCRISGKQTYLYLEDDRWFVEAKNA